MRRAIELKISFNAKFFVVLFESLKLDFECFEIVQCATNSFDSKSEGECECEALMFVTFIGV